jgi:cytidyltransferase-like protein
MVASKTWRRSIMTGVIIGRFQVPYLHLGHIHLISSALQKCDKVVILLGTSTVKDDRNPFSIIQRMHTIHRVFPQIPIIVLQDRADDKAWSLDVDNILLTLNKPVLLHSRDSFKDHYLGMFDTHEIEEIPGYSGTELRKQKT